MIDVLPKPNATFGNNRAYQLEDAQGRRYSLPEMSLRPIDPGPWESELAQGEKRPPAAGPSPIVAYPNPAAPPEVQAITKAIAAFEALPPARLEVGEAVALLEDGKVYDGVIERKFEGSDCYHVKLLSGGYLVANPEQIRGRIASAIDEAQGEPGEDLGDEEDLDAVPAGF